MEQRNKKTWSMTGCATLLVILGFGALSSNFFFVGFNYKSAKAKYIAAGLPFEAKDMLRHIPDDQNSVALVRILSSYRSVPIQEDAVPDLEVLLQAELDLSAKEEFFGFDGGRI